MGKEENLGHLSWCDAGVVRFDESGSKEGDHAVDEGDSVQAHRPLADASETTCILCRDRDSGL